MIAILDYKAGNQTSVLRALQSLEIEAQITDNNETLLSADGVIFPGVGAASQAMNRLKSTKQDVLLAQIIANKIPLLGICLGCQILLNFSEEGDTQTLGIVEGVCRKFPLEWEEDIVGDDGQYSKENIRIPHMGWNSIEIEQNSPLLKGLQSGDTVYYVHSYYPDPKDTSMVIATSTYGEKFCACYGRDGLWATQFHPEKSGKVGLQILQNFYEYAMNNKINKD